MPASAFLVSQTDEDPQQEFVWVDVENNLVRADASTGVTELQAGFGGVRFAVDHDGDGTENLVVLTTDGQTYDATLGQNLEIPSFGGPAYVAGDVDGEGSADLVEPDALIFGGPNGFTPGAALEPASYSGPVYAVGDVDGDGRADLVAVDLLDPADVPYGGHATSSLKLYLSSEYQAPVWPSHWTWHPREDHLAGFALCLADVDGDGVDEIVTTSGDGPYGAGEIVILGALDAPAGPERIASGSLEWLTTFVKLERLGDVDGDGDDEVLFTTETGLSVIDVEPDDASVLSPVGEPFDLPLPPSVDDDGAVSEGALLNRLLTAVGDLNGDGSPDVAAGVSWSGIGSVSDGGAVGVWFGPLFRTGEGNAPETPAAPEPGAAPPERRRGCGCDAAPGSGAEWLLLGLLAPALRRRRRG